MAETSTVEVENLLLAALLIVGGARLAKLDPSGRFARITLDTSLLDIRQLACDVHLLGDVLASVAPEADGNVWNWTFARSVLGRIESEYRHLKMLVTNARRDR